MKLGTQLIADERERQISEEGFDAAHDNDHNDESLAMVAACFAAPEKIFVVSADISEDRIVDCNIIDAWPADWDETWDKREYDETLPTSEKRIDLLIKAGALIAAEIDRLQRAAK